MKQEGEVKTKQCSQCKGAGTINRKHLKTGADILSGCPVCDGYGFVIPIEQSE